MTDKDININPNAERFLELIKKSRAGKFKIYIGLAAGTGKSYRMLLEAGDLLKNRIDVVIGYIETHGREETEMLLSGVPIIPRKKIFYKGREFDEFDIDAVLRRRPEVVIIDELAHSNAPGSRHEKRYQDAEEILFNGISVISALNIQHIESLNHVVREITGIAVSETVPERVIALADEVVNIDLTADELIGRMRAGKIYKKEKIETALNNFFKKEHLLQLRELALREVADQLYKKIGHEVSKSERALPEKILVCIGDDFTKNEKIIRAGSRTSDRLDAAWYVLYVETGKDSFENIDLNVQRHLINNFKMAAEQGAITEKIKAGSVAEGIVSYSKEKEITKIIVGKPGKALSLKKMFGSNIINNLVEKLEDSDSDLEIIT